MPLTSFRQQISSQLEQGTGGSSVTGQLNHRSEGTAGSNMLNAYFSWYPLLSNHPAIKSKGKKHVELNVFICWSKPEQKAAWAESSLSRGARQRRWFFCFNMNQNVIETKQFWFLKIWLMVISTVKLNISIAQWWISPGEANQVFAVTNPQTALLRETNRMRRVNQARASLSVCLCMMDTGTNFSW